MTVRGHVANDDRLSELKNILDHELLAKIPKRGVVHVGAHEGQEVEEYLRLGFERILLIEANPDACASLFAKFGWDGRISILNFAICDRVGTAELLLHTSRSGSTEPASILPMKRFSEIVSGLHTPRTIRVPAITLDALFAGCGLLVDDFNYLNLDIQGAELLALRGATNTLATMDAVISEVNVIDLYERGPLEAEVVGFLAQQGFAKRRAIYHSLYDEKSTFPAWGETLFTREPPDSSKP